MMELLTDLAFRAMDSLSQGNIGALVAVFFVSALTEVGVPFPFMMDTILFFSGYQTGPVIFKLMRIMIALLLGRVVGSAAIYWSARLLGRSFLNWSQSRFPLLRNRMDWLTVKLSHHAPTAVAVARLTPGLLTPASVVSGFMGLRYYYFVIGIVLSSVFADAAIIVLGFLTKSGIEYLGFTPSLWHAIIALPLLIVAIWIVRRFLFHR